MVISSAKIDQTVWSQLTYTKRIYLFILFIYIDSLQNQAHI